MLGRFSPELIQYRRSKLELFLNGVGQNIELSTNAFFRVFVGGDSTSFAEAQVVVSFLVYFPDHSQEASNNNFSVPVRHISLEDDDRTQQVAVNSDTPSKYEQEGYMVKNKLSGGNNWQRRYFALRKLPEDGYVYIMFTLVLTAIIAIHLVL